MFEGILKAALRSALGYHPLEEYDTFGSRALLDKANKNMSVGYTSGMYEYRYKCGCGEGRENPLSWIQWYNHLWEEFLAAKKI